MTDTKTPAKVCERVSIVVSQRYFANAPPTITIVGNER